MFADSAVYALGAGFAVMSTALDNTGHHCDVVDQAESLMMAKEHVIDDVRHAPLHDRNRVLGRIAGPAVDRQRLSGHLPGDPADLLVPRHVVERHAGDGLPPAAQRTSRTRPTRGRSWSPTQWAAGRGQPASPSTRSSATSGFFNAIVPTHACGGITDQQRYQPQTHPTGVRCSVADMAVNVFGRRAPSRVVGRGEEARRTASRASPVDNVGVQYGLDALRTLQITPAQFVDLNARIGGLDIDINPTARRGSAPTSPRSPTRTAAA